jgi:predicted Zn-dependent protease
MNCTLRRIAELLLPLVVATLLGACASTTPGGRSRLSAPDPVSSLHSSLDLNLTLAAVAPVTTSCEGLQCQVDKGFERQVTRLGTRLAEAAYATYPELKERIPTFSFVVAEKIDGGSSSDASGTIVIYRGIRKASLEEETLAYLIAREMGRVIARHHDERSAATILSSLLAQILLAPANLARGAAFLVSSTAGAFGKNWITSGTVEERLNEADAIALTLLNRQGWDDMEIADSLLDYSNRLSKDSWSEEVRRTATRLASYKAAEVLALVQSPAE